MISQGIKLDLPGILTPLLRVRVTAADMMMVQMMCTSLGMG
jgi:hypothetical protein